VRPAGLLERGRRDAEEPQRCSRHGSAAVTTNLFVVVMLLLRWLVGACFIVAGLRKVMRPYIALPVRSFLEGRLRKASALGRLIGSIEVLLGGIRRRLDPSPPNRLVRLRAAPRQRAPCGSALDQERHPLWNGRHLIGGGARAEPPHRRREARTDRAGPRADDPRLLRSRCTLDRIASPTRGGSYREGRGPPYRICGVSTMTNGKEVA